MKKTIFTFAAACMILLAAAQTQQPFPAGTYSFEISAGELPADVPKDIVPMMTGKYEITFTNDGHVTNIVDGKFDAKGRYYSTKHYLTITDEEGPGHCEGDHATGVYKWQIHEGNVSLVTIEDGCRWRAFSITLKKWKKIK